MPAEAVIPSTEIDFSLPFYPPQLTVLAHTPSWSLLDEHHRVRYSQLYALYFNEQTVFFEELLATNVLSALYQRPDLVGEKLASDLQRFEVEERRHSSWFRELNHRVDPSRFSLTTGTFVFVPAGRSTLAISAWFARRPLAFPCWIWLALIQEERSIAIARECLRCGIEPSFHELHRKHLADEVDHVRWDLELVERVWRPLPMWKRRIQARLFGLIMSEFFTAPKRASKAVLQNLIAEFPELGETGPQLHREMRDLSHSRDYHASLYRRSLTPRCFELFDKLPEFRGIEKSLLAYDPP
jgi:hypothetical protein